MVEGLEACWGVCAGPGAALPSLWVPSSPGCFILPLLGVLFCRALAGLISAAVHIS